ncbi:LOW QUALITY PROTEIN: hypothetical protein BRARA_I04084 [Brassica rapa]|uniref:Leucine-rich repeat-containing N-terminal plant-type domain-containing protein n=1 Tax=Brassica campestris TaxID=3711 RepID=A0A397YA02_BRACM|nr:LOW QUALITY PROTEIN: hypothetical protein BRARA_I04084 [Brassica rapa]
MSIFLRTIVLLYSISRILSTFASSPDQSDILLEFKNEFKIQKSCEFLDPKTKSWANKSDYCNWQGVTCETKSDKVIGLDLSCSCLHGRLKPNSSLFRLQQLRSLNLAYNSFLDSTIPAKFNKLMGLERLNLSESSFSGQVPTEIVQLTNLVSLDLSSFSSSSSSYYTPSNLSIVEPSFLRLLALNLRNLRELDMSYVNISSEIPKGQLPDFHVNKSLQRISIAQTSFSGTIPSSLGNLSHLSFLRLSYNNFIGEIPSSIGNLKQLISFHVFNNKLSGNFPSALLSLTQLRTLDLSYNQFSGSLPPNISQLSRLHFFSVRGNSFVGTIPASLFKISSLAHIDLDINHFSDLLGIENISLLSNLKYLFLGGNNYSVNVIPVDLNIFPPLKHLSGLSLSGIPLSTTNITSDFSSNLEFLYLSRCKVTEFPEFIRNNPHLHDLALSNNKMKGQVPDWLWRLPELDYLDLSRNSFSGFNGSLHLSSNAFQGPLFIPSSSIEYLFASKNNFTGELPSSICGSTSLYILDLSNNNFSGSIPWCLGTLMTSLSDLKLHNNSLNGTLPDIFINAKKLQTLDISHNLLEGKLPASLINCSSLEVLNLESNKFKDTFPFHLSSLQKLQVLVLHSNKFYGKLHHSDGVWSGFPQLKIIDVSHNDFLSTLPSDYFLNWTGISSKTGNNSTEPDYIGAFLPHQYYASIVLMAKGVSMEMERILKVYTAIDFSGNQLHGQIPESIGLLKELRILNMSSNAFTGHIPSSLANLTVLESLDLSQNKLSGEIPPELGNLYSLEWINVSHNQLVGSIPQGTQFQRQNCSDFLVLLLRTFVRNEPTSQQPEQPESLQEEEEDEGGEWLSWMAAGIGFAPGVVFGITIGYIVAYYKNEWFMKLFRRTRTC